MVKPLPVPITLLIEVSVAYHWDSKNGNSYHSQRIVINRDHDNTLYFTMTYGKPSTLQSLSDLLSMVSLPSYSQPIDILQAKDVHVSYNEHTTTLKRCKAYGKQG